MALTRSFLNNQSKTHEKHSFKKREGFNLDFNRPNEMSQINLTPNKVCSFSMGVVMPPNG